MKQMFKRRAAIASSVALAGAGVLGFSATGARGQGALPKGPVRILVGYLPGGSADTLARLIAQKFAERTGLTTLVENKPGAGGIIATEMVVKAPPDGNTLILANMASTIMAKLTYSKLPYDPQKDLAPISLLCTSQNALAVAPSVPVSNTEQFVAWAKANPDKMNFGAPAIGGQIHFFIMMLGKAMGVDVQVVPYKGTTQMVTDLSSGQLSVGMSSVWDLQAQHEAGKIKIIATSGKERAEATPNIPTFGETGFPTLAGEGWFAMYAAPKTPEATITAISVQIQEIIRLPEIRTRLSQLSLNPRGSTPAGLAEFDEQELQRWQPIVMASGFKAD